MQIDSGPIVDPYSIIVDFANKGLATETLRKCNSQSFKPIDGYGTGAFLLTSQLYTSGSTVTLSDTNISSRSIYVTDVINISHPSSVGNQLQIILTAEEKFIYSRVSVTRDFNVIERRKQKLGGAPTLAPDVTTKTLQQIINEITGTTCNYTASTVYPYDVFLQGMSVIEAMDTLCACYGMYWVVHAGTIYVYDVVTPSAITYEKLSDIQYSANTPAIQTFEVTYPILDCCVVTPRSFHKKTSSTASTPGHTVRTYCPFYPAVFDVGATTVPTNDTVLNSGLTFLKTKFEAINLLLGNYYVLANYRNINHATFKSGYTITYSDYGTGPQTTLSARSYPYLEQPYVEPLDRQARHWIGYLYQTYKGAIAGFWVIPGFGFDGEVPEENQYVVNLFNWNYGASGAVVEIQWDCINYRWVAVQQEYVCPPSTTPPAPDGPPIPPTYSPFVSPGE